MRSVPVEEKGGTFRVPPRSRSECCLNGRNVNTLVICRKGKFVGIRFHLCRIEGIGFINQIVLADIIEFEVLRDLSR